MIVNVLAFICGKTGTGKSTILNYIIKREYELGRRAGIVVLDFRGDHLNLLNLKDFKYLKVWGELLDRYKINWAGVLEKYPFLIIEPYNITQQHYAELGNQIAEGLLKVQNRIFIIEESQICFNVYERAIRRGLSILITSGRKLGLDLYFTAQRPVLVSPTAISQANVYISFALNDKNDLERMKYYLPQDVSQLERFQFFGFNVFTHTTINGNTSNPEIVEKVLWEHLK